MVITEPIYGITEPDRLLLVSAGSVWIAPGTPLDEVSENVDTSTVYTGYRKMSAPLHGVPDNVSNSQLSDLGPVAAPRIFLSGGKLGVTWQLSESSN